MKTKAFLICLLALPFAEAAKFKDSCERLPMACQKNSTPERRVPSYDGKVGEVEGEPGQCWWSCDPEEFDRVEGKKGKYAKEMQCWRGVFGKSYSQSAGKDAKFAFPYNFADKDLIVFSVQDGYKQTYYFATSNGGYKDEFNQIKDSEKKEYAIYDIEAKQWKYIYLDSSANVRSDSSFIISDSGDDPKAKELVEEGDARFREKILQALQERVQNVRSTFDYRKQNRSERFAELNRGKGRNGKSIADHERSEEIARFPKEQKPEDYTGPLNKCLDVFGDDQKYAELVGTINAELAKFANAKGAGEGKQGKK